MSKIHILPNFIINQIAAGEVVERPASVVKELIENSIDADADEIKLLIEGGGKKLIKVIDNGTGMDKENARMAFLPHATSKISKIEDLDNILTLGFRGEALASISSVSKIKLITKTKDVLSGFALQLEQGEIITEAETASITGTSISISSLFYNTPARQKFLKADATELRHIINTFTEIAITNPKIKFEFYHNNRKLFDLPGAIDRKERLRNLIGEEFTNNTFQIFYDGIIKISGFAGLPKIATRRKSTQIIIINKRPVKNSTIQAAVKEAYHTSISKELYPQYVLFIKVDPAKVDVNVHPRKLEVRFNNQQEIFNSVKTAIKDNLEKFLQQQTKNQINRYSGNTNGFKSSPTTSRVEDRKSGYNTREYKPAKSEVQKSLEFTKAILEKSPDQSFPWDEEDNIKSNDQLTNNHESSEEHYPAHQYLNAYIISTNGNSIQIIDQHAAAERITFEKLYKSFKQQKFELQTLLIPYELKFNPQEILLLKEKIDILEKFGLYIEEFGRKNYVIKQIPVILKNADINQMIHELLSELEKTESDETKITDEYIEKIIAAMACHTSIRIGDKLSQQEIDQLLNELKACRLPYSCPHGRPIIYEIPISEIERKFKRK